MRNKGFTLIELMILVAVVAILLAIAIPAFFEYKKKAEEVRAIEIEQGHGIYRVQDIRCGKANCMIILPPNKAILKADKVRILQNDDAAMRAADD